MPTAGTGPPEQSKVNWELIIQALGVVAALFAWVGVVGAARTWARLEAANIPALPTLAALDQSWFVAEGLQVLVRPVLIGGLTGLLVYFSWPKPPARERDGAPAGTRPGERAPGPAADSSSEPDAAEKARARRSDPGPEQAGPTGPPPEAVRTAPSPEIGQAAPSPEAGQAAPPREAGQAAPPEAATAEPRKSRFWRLKPVDNVVRIAEGQGSTAWAWAIPAAIAMFGLTYLFMEGRRLVFVSAAILAVAMLVAAMILVRRMARAGRSTPRDGAAAAASPPPGRDDRRLTIGRALVAAAGAVLIIGYLASIILAVHAIQLWIILLVTIAGIWITLGAIDVDRPGKTAFVLFVAVVAWSGALAYAQEAGDRNPELTRATVWLKSGAQEHGGYLGRTSDRVLIARPLDPPNATRDVLVLPADDVSCITLSDQVEVGPNPSKTATRSTAPCLTPPSSAPPSSSAAPSSSSAPPSVGNSPPASRRPVPTTSRAAAGADPGPVIVDTRGPETPIASRDATVGGKAVQLQVLALVRRGDRYVALDARVVNLSPRPVTPAAVFGTGPAFDSVKLFDPDRRLLHFVVRADGRCVCDTGLDRVTVPPGAAALLSAAFEVPDRRSSRVDLLFPTFGWLRGVPLA